MEKFTTNKDVRDFAVEHALDDVLHLTKLIQTRLGYPDENNSENNGCQAGIWSAEAKECLKKIQDDMGMLYQEIGQWDPKQ